MLLRIVLIGVMNLSIACQPPSPKKVVTYGLPIVVEELQQPKHSLDSTTKVSMDRLIPNDVLRQLKGKLAARFRHEILWHDVPEGFYLPKDHHAQLMLYQTSDSIWYCSPDSSTCGRYRINNSQLGQRTDSTICEGGDRKSSLVKFIEKTITIGHDLSLRGRDYSDGSFGSITLTLNTQEEAINYYRQLHPAKIQSLRDWIQRKSDEYSQNGYRSITIAAFDASDPNVHLYSDRLASHGGSLIFSVFWNDEIKDWEFEGMLTEEQSPETFSQQKAIVQAIACDTIKFK